MCFFLRLQDPWPPIHYRNRYSLGKVKTKKGKNVCVYAHGKMCAHKSVTWLFVFAINHSSTDSFLPVVVQHQQSELTQKTHMCAHTFIGTDNRGRGNISPLVSRWLVISIPPLHSSHRCSRSSYTSRLPHTHTISLLHTHTGIILMVCCCRGGRALVSFRLQATAKVLFACSD